MGPLFFRGVALPTIRSGGGKADSSAKKSENPDSRGGVPRRAKCSTLCALSSQRAAFAAFRAARTLFRAAALSARGFRKGAFVLIDSLTFSLERSGCLDAFWGRLDAGEDAALGVAGSARPFLVAARFAHRPQPTLAVVAGEDAAAAFARSLAAYLGEERVLRFPERSDFPFSPKPNDPSQVARRMEAAHALASGRQAVVVASARSLLRALPPAGAGAFLPVALEAGRELADMPSSATSSARSRSAATSTPGSSTAPARSPCAAAPWTCSPATSPIRCAWTSSATSWRRSAASCPRPGRPSPRFPARASIRSWSSPARSRVWRGRARSSSVPPRRTPRCARCSRRWRGVCASTAPTRFCPTCTTPPPRSATTRPPTRLPRSSSRGRFSTTWRTPMTTCSAARRGRASPRRACTRSPRT